jgi:hypothetical protein
MVLAKGDSDSRMPEGRMKTVEITFGDCVWF